MEPDSSVEYRVAAEEEEDCGGIGGLGEEILLLVVELVVENLLELLCSRSRYESPVMRGGGVVGVVGERGLLPLTDDAASLML